MLRPKLLYFLYYAATASLLPFLVLYYAQLGFSGRQIGVLSALLPVMTLLGVPLWSAAADASGRYRTVILLSAQAALVLTLLSAWATTYLRLLAVVGGLSLCVAPLMPLTDTAVLAVLGHQRHRYGKLRLWGAVGWGVGAPVTGWLVERSEARAAFWLAATLFGFFWAVSYTLPRLEPSQPAPRVRRNLSTGFYGVQCRIQTIVQTAVQATVQATVRQLLTPAWLGFLLIGFAGGLGLAVSSSFLYLYLTDLGLRASLIGLALTVATLSELPVFFFSGWLLRRYPAEVLLEVALAVFAVRLLFYGVLTAPWSLLALGLLHGPSFSLLWASGVAYADLHAPAGLRATAQGLFNAALLGWGGVAGALVGGALYDTWGAAAMFLWVAAATAAVCLGVSVWGASRRTAKRKPKEL